MAGIQNLPLGTMQTAASAHGATGTTLPGDNMTMKMIGLGQTIPYPGKLGLRRKIAEREVDAALAALTASRRETARDVKKAYFELGYLDQALAVVGRNQAVLTDIIRVTEARYGSGIGGQQDVLKARVEASRSGEIASTLIEQRRSTLAELNALLARETTTSVTGPGIPQRISDAAIARDPSSIRFVAQTLGSRLAGSPLPSLDELQDLAVRNNAALEEMESRIAAQSARVALAQKAYKPDIDVSLQYGQRDQRPDMITALVSFPLPIHKRARQDQELAEAHAELTAMESEYRAEVNHVRSEVARLVNDLERSRTQLALYRKAILPQGEAAVSSSLAAYQAGKGDFLSVLDNQGTLFAYQTANYRALADFAKTLADLEEKVGTEVLR